MKTCIQCETNMEEQGYFSTGSARYMLYKCASCSAEDAKCIGVYNDA